MTTDGCCACPDVPFGDAWSVAADFSTITCQRCGGKPRPEQERRMAAEWVAGMPDRRAANQRPPFPPNREIREGAEGETRAMYIPCPICGEVAPRERDLASHMAECRQRRAANQPRGVLPILDRHHPAHPIGKAEMAGNGALRMTFREPVPLDALLNAGFGFVVVEGETREDGSQWLRVADVYEWSPTLERPPA